MYKIYKEVWEELTEKDGPFSVKEIEVRGSPMRVYDKAPNNLGDICKNIPKCLEKYRKNNFSERLLRNHLGTI